MTALALGLGGALVVMTLLDLKRAINARRDAVLALESVLLGAHARGTR